MKIGISSIPHGLSDLGYKSRDLIDGFALQKCVLVVVIIDYIEKDKSPLKLVHAHFMRDWGAAQVKEFVERVRLRLQGMVIISKMEWIDAVNEEESQIQNSGTLAANIAPFFNLKPFFVYELGDGRWNDEAEQFITSAQNQN